MAVLPAVAIALGVLMMVAVLEEGTTVSKAIRSKGFSVEVSFVPPPENDETGISADGGAQPPAAVLASDLKPVPTVVLPTDGAGMGTGMGMGLGQGDDATAKANKAEKVRRRDAWKYEIIRMHPRVNYCKPTYLVPDPKPAAGTAIYLGCFPEASQTAAPDGLGEASATLSGKLRQQGGKCADSCVKPKEMYGHLDPFTGMCECRAAFGEHGLASSEKACGSASKSKHQRVFKAGLWPPPATSPNIKTIPAAFEKGVGVKRQFNKTVTFLVWANERLATIFRTCRLAAHSLRFEYDVYDLRHQVRNNNQTQVAELLRRFPGPKVIIFDGCCVPGWLINAWPPNSVLVIASDESARWGFSSVKKGKNGNIWGPHDPAEENPVAMDAERRIIMPENTKPWFKQYYSKRHLEHFGNEVRYIPLGSREEFEEVPREYKPPSARKYLYSFMGAPTDIGRKKVAEILKDDTLIDKKKVSRQHVACVIKRACSFRVGAGARVVYIENVPD
jgi:hypothetical protein